MAKISADENLHMIFYRDVSEAAFDLVPNQAMKSLHLILSHFQMPGFQVPEFRRKAVVIAVGVSTTRASTSTKSSCRY